MKCKSSDADDLGVKYEDSSNIAEATEEENIRDDCKELEEDLGAYRVKCREESCCVQRPEPVHHS